MTVEEKLEIQRKWDGLIPSITMEDALKCEDIAFNSMNGKISEADANAWYETIKRKYTHV